MHFIILHKSGFHKHIPESSLKGLKHDRYIKSFMQSDSLRHFTSSLADIFPYYPHHCPLPKKIPAPYSPNP